MLAEGQVLRDAGVELRADPGRVVAKLHLPGEGPHRAHSRAAGIISRVVRTPAAELADAAESIVRDFGDRHDRLPDLLHRHAVTVAGHADPSVPALSADQAAVVGAAFTMEYAVEGAALCNPSAVPHPDQSGLGPGELRIALALRAIGEGHISSIGFASAVVGAGGWRFEERRRPVSTAAIGDGEWSQVHFRETLEREGRLDELSLAIVRSLPPTFRSDEIETAIRDLPVELSQRRDVHGDLDTIRTLARSAYRAEFSEQTDLSQRALLPFAAEESNGMEDARFVLFRESDGRSEYRATYTAYDGRTVAPRLIVSDDLRRFRIHRLSGTASAHKGMAVFPRRIGGEMLALTRTDGENIALARSDDGLSWGDEQIVHAPEELWEVVQTGNCGSPIETDRGWLVPIHGVGPMRVYSLGMLLLDLDDPRRVLGRLDRPLLIPAGALRDGYVPNVVYSCGAIVHDGTLWIPYGVGDARVRVGSIPLGELLDALSPVPS